MEEKTEYPFSDLERVFFTAQMDQINRLITAMNNAANLVVMQQGLEGRWSLKPDGSGLIKEHARNNSTDL